MWNLRSHNWVTLANVHFKFKVDRSTFERKTIDQFCNTFVFQNIFIVILLVNYSTIKHNHHDMQKCHWKILPEHKMNRSGARRQLEQKWRYLILTQELKSYVYKSWQDMSKRKFNSQTIISYSCTACYNNRHLHHILEFHLQVSW